MDTTVTDAQLRARQATLIATVERELRTVTSVVLGERFRSIEKKQSNDRREYFALEDTQGGSASLWLDAIPMVSELISNTMTNTTTDQYIVQISDRLPSEFLTRFLAHEVGELIAVRDRSSQGLAPVRENLLNQEADLGDRHELSSRDHGRIAELNWLATQASDTELPGPQRAEARADLSALIDRCGMRPVSAAAEAESYEAETEAADTRRYVSWNFFSYEAKHLVSALARPIEQLDPTDATALQASRDAALRAERQVEAFIGRREVTMPMPGYDQNGLPLPRDQLESAATQWAEYRAQVSARTAQAIEGQLAQGEFPRRRVVIGGGASLTGRDADALLIDGAGRWHLDPGRGIVQSADQDRDLAEWMGVDPHSTVERPGDRLPIHAVRVWEDQLATRGDVVNGHARLRLGRDSELLVEIRTLGEDGQESATPLWVACEGTPSIATGLTPEVVPGMPRGEFAVESRSEAVRLIGDRLRELEGQGLPGAGEMRAWLIQAERGGTDARTVLGALNSSPLLDALTAGLGTDRAGRARLDNCVTALESTAQWETSREEAPGRVLLGDEVAENRFDAHQAEHWVVAGSGGTGVANAEIILTQNLDARVTIIGSAPPPALRHQVQFPAMEKTYGPGGDGRLTFIRAQVGAIETYQDEQTGETRFQIPYEEGDGENKQRKMLRTDGYVTSLGRTNPLPSALQVLADEVRDRGGEISGDLQFDKDDQYIGYGLTFTVDGKEHRVDVDGAASWQLPREVFAPETGLQQQLNEMGARGLPAETGNAAPGFAPIARQSALRARAVAAAEAGDKEAVQRRSTVPDRWLRPELGPETESGTGTDTEPPRTGPGNTAPPQEKAPLQEQARSRAQASEAERDPTPAAPKPARHQAVPGSHLWQLGVPHGRTSPLPGPTQQPQQPPPGHQRPEPGLGMGD
ncbi:hypothetical protein JIX56_21230 [Streptomyces sp. CA-210063]|uniref:hypothetical protein n=1 Tax=Streptomyces sp. CA-210063 TaxID=2801029 RepID=UPI00214B8140|nr:hypothetical protein [Streptomyces sp. CA-210063]UUU32225.1 hypothetical protein JIX56_21230 [Streptomyces sp. CA-210063]